MNEEHKCGDFQIFKKKFSKMAEGIHRNSRPGQERSTHNECVTNAKELDSQKSKEKNASRDPCGLINQGMTCYLNAVLQTLFMTDKFRDQVTSSSTNESPEEKAVADLFRSLQRERTAVSTEEVTKVLNITDVFEQQDAAEYLQMILHKIPEPSKIFRGIVVTSTVCSDCKHNNKEETDFLSIPLTIDARGRRDVKYALLEYLGIHDMSGDDQLYCVRCDSMRDMEMGNYIQKWPDILTLQLKRFEMSFTQNKLQYWKNECNVEIPPHLQLDSEYELYTIINHHGSFISGHYFTFAKSQSGNWYSFNDDRVGKMDHINQWISDCSTSAYLLMYRKVTKEVASSGQDEETNDPQTDISEGIRNNPQLKNPEEDHTNVKEQIKPSMINTESSKKSSESESYSKMFKQRLKEAFQCLNEEILPGERQKLNDVFIEPHIIEEHDSHIRDKRQIKCNDIFEGKSIRTVLMKGEAGIGKTVAVQKFVLDWAEEKLNHDIEYIFPIPFQKLNILRETAKECSFMELLQRCCENTEHLNPESRIMLIFDGLNEFKVPLENTKKFTNIKEPASVSDLLTNLIMGNLLPNARIWITSRPAAANQIPAGFIDRVTEIHGFNDQQKEYYFRKSISDQSMANKVISHIQKSPRINSMCYLPDYCRIIAAIPEEMFRTDETGSDFPKTLTQMYSKLLLAQMNLNRERKENIIALGKTAFDWLVNSKSLFCDEDLKQRGLRDESVLKKSLIIKRIEDKSKCKLFCFLNHRTKEFLAALYVTEIINREKVCQLRDLSSLKLEFGEQSFTDFFVLQHIIDKTLQKQMELFFCFLLGFRPESSQIALKELLTQRSSSSSSTLEIIQHIKTMIMNSSSENAVESSLLLDCLRELDDRCLIQEIKTQLKSGLRLSPAQFSALLFVLLNSEEQIDKSHQSEELKLRPVVKISGEHEEYQCGIGVRACADLKSNPSHLRELDLSGNFLGDSGMKHLSDLLKMCKLEKLRLRFCFINEEACAVLSSALRSNPSHLRELDLSENNITDLGMQQLSALLKHPQCKLEKLGLYACLIKEEDCSVLSSALRSNQLHLKELDLSGNDIKYSGLKLLSSLLADHQCKLEKLWLNSCHIKEEGCAVLSSALRSNPSYLRELDLSKNDIGHLGLKQLSDLLAEHQCKLQKLWLTSCQITNEGCADLSSALRSNPSHLRELDLSGNNISYSGIQQLSYLLTDLHCKLEKLRLRSCYISDRACADLSSALRSNPSHLRELDLSENKIVDSGMKQLSALLKHTQCKLEKLWLRSCDISDRGCADLSSALRSNPSHLRELDLSGNNITESEMQQISDLLKHPQCKLEKLGLRSCRIKKEGCAVLSSALRSNPSHLRELDLSGNYFTDSGTRHLSALLEDPQCKLEKLWLRSCDISDRGCAVLSSALRSNQSHLRELDLSENNITESEMQQISDLLKHPLCKLEKLWLKCSNKYQLWKL